VRWYSPVYETPAGIEDLQARREHSITQASPFLRRGGPVYLRMEPTTLYTYARYPDQVGPEAG
jgi:hypothetical protein